MTGFSKELYPLRGKKVFVAGHRGMLGSALIRRLAKEECSQIITATKEELDLRDQRRTLEWMLLNRPDAIFLCAAKVGGIVINDSYPVDFLNDNLSIYMNIINAAHACDTEKLLFLGSSCIYPKYSKQPITEEELLSGSLETTNQWYAIAKIAGIKLCQAYRKQYKMDFIVAMPTNLYGPGDNFDVEYCHVIPGLIYKAHSAKLRNDNEIKIWGTGTSCREFLYVDDCADALIFLMKSYSESLPINIGYGSDIAISDLALIIIKCVGYKGALKFDISKPDGTPRKLLNSKRLRYMGWLPKIGLKDGIQKTYSWFLKKYA